MRRLLRRSCFIAAPVLAMGAFSLSPVAAAAANGGSSTCQVGSVAAGTYSNLNIAGFCAIDSGNVTVLHNLTVLPNGGLNAAFGGSDLHVHGNLDVQNNGILVLGCEPSAFPCFNDDPNNPTMSTSDTVGGNLGANGALMMLVHNNQIGGNVTQSGGGGGVTCATQPLGPNGPPAYSTYEDNAIGKNASITEVQTCWMGFIRNNVSGNVNYQNNVTADDDGNEVVTNTVARNLNCSGNSPAPQFGDSGGIPNTVSGHANGQCAGPLSGGG